jgi:hypothetical protein
MKLSTPKSLATIIATVYFLVTVEFYTIFYNYWAILGLDIFLVVFWLISFPLAASEARHYYQVTPYEDGCFDDDYGKLRRRQECFRDSSSATYRNVLRVIAVFGAFELYVSRIANLGAQTNGLQRSVWRYVIFRRYGSASS